MWGGFFAVPLIIMFALDGFCSGRELCHAGLSFTLLIYGIGIVACVIGILLARLSFRFLDPSPRTRILTMKALFLIPLIPAIIILVLLAGGLLGRLG